MYCNVHVLQMLLDLGKLSLAINILHDIVLYLLLIFILEMYTY